VAALQRKNCFDKTNRPNSCFLFIYCRMWDSAVGSIAGWRYCLPNFAVRSKRRNSESHAFFDPQDLIGKLAALVPPPRFNLVRYHGVLAPSANWRSQIAPVGLQDEFDSENCPGCSEKEGKKGGAGKQQENPKIPRQVHLRNYGWAKLMKRVFGYDVLRCDCGGRMRILCAINPPKAIKKILDCLGLPSRPPPIYFAVSGSLSIFSEHNDPTTSASRLKKEMCVNYWFFSS
jgi:hypothetical protein